MGNITKEEKLIAVYGRVSTSLQEDQKTIEAQLLEVRKFAVEHGYTIIREYLDEGWSGDTLERPALDSLRLDSKKKMWDAVLVYDPDRLSRRYAHQELVIDELRERQIEILFVTVPPVKDLNDRMLGGMRGLFAEYERGKITERFRLGKLSRINKGHILVSEAPYGYTYIENAGKKGTPEYVVGHYVINESEACNVRDMFKWVADEGLTLRGVIKRFQERGVYPRKSKRGVWSTSTLSTLLRNQTYIGKAHWGTSFAVVPEKPLREQKYRRNKKTSRKMRPTDEWLSIAVPRIVEDDVFHRAGKRLKDNFDLMGRNKKNQYLLGGKIWCTCGRRRTGEGPKQGKHLYYRCTDRVYSFPLPRTCNEKGVNARIADEIVWHRVEQIMSSPELLKAQIERWKKDQKNNAGEKLVVDTESIKREIQKLKTREGRYTTAYSEEVITLDKLKEYLAPIKENVASLEKSLVLASVAQAPKPETQFPREDEIELFAKDAVRYAGSLSFEAKRGIMLGSLDKIYATQKGMQVYGALNLHEISVEYFSKNYNQWNEETIKKYVEYFPKDRHRGPSQCGKVDTL